MSFAEYKIRLHAFNRSEVKRLKEMRRTWYTTLVAPYQDPKKLAKNEVAFMPFAGEAKKELSQAAINKFERKMKAYQEHKRQRENG